MPQKVRKNPRKAFLGPKFFNDFKRGNFEFCIFSHLLSYVGFKKSLRSDSPCVKHES